MSLADHGHWVVRVSARPPSKFSATADFALWIQRFEIYLSEAEIPLEKRARELLSLLDDGPFRIVTQLGLVDSDDYSCVKEQLQKHNAPKGDDLEWLYRLQNRRQKSGEPLSEFVGELRMMTDKAYPEWEPKQRLEIARNQFIQGIETPSIQLVLMREKPKTLEDALALAQRHLAVETAQKRLHRRPLEQHAAQSLAESQTMTYGDETNALYRSGGATANAQLEGLSRQVQWLSEELAQMRGEGERSKPPKRVPPICWGCNERGHLRRNCPRWRPPPGDRQHNRSSKPQVPFSSSSMATEPAVSVEGFIGERPTKILVDTGSSVTILREDVWKEAVNTRSLEPPPSPVIAANREQLEIRGLSEVNLRVGDICACYPVLVAKNVTQECLLGADFLEKFGCIIDLRGRTLTTRRTSVPIQFRKTLQKVRSRFYWPGQ